MKKLLNTLFVTSEDAYLSLDGENIVVSRDRHEIGRFPLHTLAGIVSFSYAGTGTRRTCRRRWKKPSSWMSALPLNTRPGTCPASPTSRTRSLGSGWTRSGSWRQAAPFGFTASPASVLTWRSECFARTGSM